MPPLPASLGLTLQYDVRQTVVSEGDSEKDSDGKPGKVRRVRNLGKPVDLSARCEWPWFYREMFFLAHIICPLFALGI